MRAGDLKKNQVVDFSAVPEYFKENSGTYDCDPEQFEKDVKHYASPIRILDIKHVGDTVEVDTRWGGWCLDKDMEI